MGKIIKEIDGLPVIDAKKSITVHVTSNDINRADMKEPHNCAVARACRRDLHVIEARVHLSRVYLRSNEGNWMRYVTPRSMRSEIIAFDRGGRFEPGEFSLKAPQPTKQLGRHSGGRKKGKKNAKPRQKPAVVKDVRTGPA